MIPTELKFSFFLLLFFIERETGPLEVSEHKLVLHETLTQLFSPCIVFC